MTQLRSTLDTMEMSLSFLKPLNRSIKPNLGRNVSQIVHTAFLMVMKNSHWPPGQIMRSDNFISKTTKSIESLLCKDDCFVHVALYLIYESHAFHNV